MKKWSEGGGRAGTALAGASSTLTKIVLFSSSVYTVFHSVIFNSVFYCVQSCKKKMADFFYHYESEKKSFNISAF